MDEPHQTLGAHRGHVRPSVGELGEAQGDGEGGGKGEKKRRRGDGEKGRGGGGKRGRGGEGAVSNTSLHVS